MAGFNWTVADDAPHLVEKARLPIRLAREKIKGPAERLRRRLVAREQEGQQVIDELRVLHRVARLWVLGREKSRAKIALGGRMPSPLRDKVAHSFAHVARRIAPPRSARKRQVCREADDAVGERPGYRQEIIAVGPFERDGDGLVVAPQHRLGDDAEGDARHVGVDAARPIGCVGAPDVDLLQSRRRHCRHVVQDIGVAKLRGRSLALPTPVRVFRRQQPVAEHSAEDLPLHRRLREVLAVIEQDALHERWIAHVCDAPAHLIDELVIDRLRHDAERVIDEMQEVLRDVVGLLGAADPRRIERCACISGLSVDRHGGASSALPLHSMSRGGLAPTGLRRRFQRRHPAIEQRTCPPCFAGD